MTLTLTDTVTDTVTVTALTVSLTLSLCQWPVVTATQTLRSSLSMCRWTQLFVYNLIQIYTRRSVALSGWVSLGDSHDMVTLREPWNAEAVKDSRSDHWFTPVTVMGCCKVQTVYISLLVVGVVLLIAGVVLHFEFPKIVHNSVADVSIFIQSYSIICNLVLILCSMTVCSCRIQQIS